MTSSALYHFLIYKVQNFLLKGGQLVQVEDTCGGGNDIFITIESKDAVGFLSVSRVEPLRMEFNDQWIDNHEN